MDVGGLMKVSIFFALTGKPGPVFSPLEDRIPKTILFARRRSSECARRQDAKTKFDGEDEIQTKMKFRLAEH